VVVDRLEVGGVEKVAMQQVAALRALGQDAELVLLRRRGDGLDVFADELAQIPVRALEERLPRPARGSLPMPGFSFLQTFHLTYPVFARRLVRAGEFDAVLAHGTYTCLTALAAGKARSIPVAAFVWDPTYHVLSSGAYSDRPLRRALPVLLPIARRFDAWLARRASLIVLAGVEFRAYLETLGASRILISYPAATPVDKPLDADARAPEMLAVTAWKHGKQPERLLGLLERTKGLRLVLAGAWLDPAYRAEFEGEVRRRSLDHRVELTGPLSEEALAERYARARFVVQTWPSPGFGLSPLEAAASGTTFVVPRAQGSGELFRDGVDGFLFDAGDDTRLIQAVEQLAGDPRGAAEMGLRAWRHVREEHTWSARATELVQALSGLHQDGGADSGQSGRL
jgi:glycosyltransferase involved in cell wall biosynthesis